MLFLTPAELEQLTGRKRPSAQMRQLGRQGIPFVQNAAGRVLVVRSHLEARSPKLEVKSVQPNWSALDGLRLSSY